jgi:hypothetical protein
MGSLGPDSYLGQPEVKIIPTTFPSCAGFQFEKVCKFGWLEMDFNSGLKIL